LNPIIDSSTPPWSFKVAFWRDPDLSDTLLERLDYRINLLSNSLKETLGSDLIACGYRDIEIYLIDDHRDLLAERGKGEFPPPLRSGPYRWGGSISPGLEDWDPYEPILEEIPSEVGGRGCGVWVRADSKIETVSVRAPTSRRWMGIASSAVSAKAALAGRSKTGGPSRRPIAGPLRMNLRLVTGLATERPIETAFLPPARRGTKAVGR
jgi:hypothetical protein